MSAVDGRADLEDSRLGGAAYMTNPDIVANLFDLAWASLGGIVPVPADFAKYR